MTRTLRLLTIAVVFVWGAIAGLYARDALAAGNPTGDIAKVERVISRWTPYKATRTRYQLNGRTYICRFFDNAPNVASQDFDWQVVVCRAVKNGSKA